MPLILPFILLYHIKNTNISNADLKIRKLRQLSHSLRLSKICSHLVISVLIPLPLYIFTSCCKYTVPHVLPVKALNTVPSPALHVFQVKVGLHPH